MDAGSTRRTGGWRLRADRRSRVRSAAVRRQENRDPPPRKPSARSAGRKRRRSASLARDQRDPVGRGSARGALRHRGRPGDACLHRCSETSTSSWSWIGEASSSASRWILRTGRRRLRCHASGSAGRRSTSSARHRPVSSSIASNWRSSDAVRTEVPRRIHGRVRPRRRRNRGRVPHAVDRAELQLRSADAHVLHHPRRIDHRRAVRPQRGIPMGWRLLERQRRRRLAR